ncbi:efflux RND transporter periplasmic adaptor subunit [Mesorhizobium sp. YM1C-6-2]|uniref:efflux RND transporter periplasmic adaptor subunit n=1 Tax=Mesorhizobium sp. YM1C-6-2 TaxID=1827501 RepID=UPI000EF196A5|nr:efflux RND transporter periplasmic adaptor subunit [Mesorhizobium sp. YM1C-6-2]RLP23179.1 efflux RND transporter periplasmic adaptor subunit [Mesorhizobium sp. YM1C-6-2]
MILRFIIAFVLVVLVCGGIVGFNMFRDQAIQDFFANMPVAPVTVSTIKVEPIEWTPGIEAIGTVAAARGVDLTVEAAGVVKEIRFKSNQRVTQGDVLVQLDDAVQRADLEAAKTQAALDQQRLERAMELQKRRVGSDVAVDEAQAASSASKSQVAKLQAVLDQRQLRAPFSGTIGIPRIDVGQYLSPSQVVATLQDLETMRADFSVPEQRLAQLEIGQPVRFGVTTNDMPFTGSIVGIDPKVDPATRLVAVRAEITNPQGLLSPGQYVQARVQLPAESDVIALPQTALVSSLYGDYIYVVRPKEGAAAAGSAGEAAGQAAGQEGEAAPEKAEGEQAPVLVARQIFVKPGRRNQNRVEVTEGVKPGDEVVTAGQNRLSNGAVVVIDNTIDPTTRATQAAMLP